MPTDNLEQLSDEELIRMAGGSDDLESLSDEELIRLASEESPSKKSLPEILGMNLKKAAKETYTEGVAPILHGVSTAAFGLPKVLARKVSPEFEKQVFPEQETGSGKSLRFISEVGGYFGGGASKLAQKAASKFTNKAVKGAVGGAVGGGTQLDVGGQTGVGEKGPTLKGQAMQAITGAGVGAAAVPIVAGVKSVGGFLGKKSTPFLKKVQDAVWQSKYNATEKFGSQIDELVNKSPDNRASLRETIDNFSERYKGGTEKLDDGRVLNLDPDPKLRAAIRRSPKTKQLFENPDLADDLSVRDMQDIINEVQSKVTPQKLKGGGIRSDDRAVMDFIHEIKGAQLDAFPEMAGIRDSYKQSIRAYNNVRNKLLDSNIKKNLVSGFGDEPLVQESFEKLLDKQLVEEVKNFKNTQRLLNATGLVARKTLEGAAIGTAGTILFNRFRNH